MVRFRRNVALVGAAIAAVALSACAHEAAIIEASVGADGRTLRLIVGSCNADLSADIEESRSRVTVTVTAWNDTTDDCLDGPIVHLEQPLGERRLLGGRTGERVPVRVDP